MNKPCKEFVDYIIGAAPKYDKRILEKDVYSKFNLIKDRKVYHNNFFAVRFCYSKSTSSCFSNTVLSLSALEKYDKIPFFVVLVRKNEDNLILLSNTTFLRKISHSSHELSMTNIKGSFNGSDIIKEFNNITNAPENFDYLFSIHQGFDWKDNLLRLVDATSGIKSISQRFVPSDTEERNIFSSINRAKDFVSSSNFDILNADLNERCNQCKEAILLVSHIENVNIRGRLIESLITSDDEDRKKLIANVVEMESALPTYDTQNGLGDYIVQFDNSDTYTDIKTKVVYLNSNPKAYNIDKFLKQMADQRSVFLFFFIGLDKSSVFNTLLCSVYHRKLIDNTVFQFHWAGRSSRGVAQFNGKAIDEMLKEENFENVIDLEKSKCFLSDLLRR